MAGTSDGRGPSPARDKAVNRFEARSGLLRLQLDHLPRLHGEHSVLNLFTNGTFEVVWDEITRRGSDNCSWSGHLADDPFSAVSMTVVEDAMAMDIISPRHGRFTVHRQADGFHRAMELNTEAMKGGEKDYVVAPAGANWQTLSADTAAAVAQGAQGFAPVTMDVMVVYTHSALVNAGSRSALVAMAQNAVNAENGNFTRSQVVHTMRLVHTREVASFDGSGNLGTDLGVVAGSSEVASLRNLVGADVVALFSYPDNTSTLGIAFELLNTNGDAGAVFSANAWGTASGVWPHEVGHNLGCAHNTADTGVYPYSHGHYWNDNGTTYGSLMSYVGSRVPYFSNPNVLRNGFATGLLNTNDNARSINDAGPLVAAYRAAKLLMDASVGLASSSLSPAENSNFQITVNVTNAGPTIASNIQVFVTLPSGITCIADDGAGGFTSGSGLWSVPNLAASANTALHLTLRPNAGTAGATLPVTATVSSVGSACVDFDYYNNFATNNIVPSPDAALSFVWTNSLGGNWNVAGNWSNNFAPIAGGSNNYAFNLVGSQPFISTNNLAGSLLMNRLTLDVSSNASSTLAGNPLQLSASSFGTAPEVRQANLGSWIISNNLLLATDTAFNATGSGAVTLAGNISGFGDLIKSGSHTLTLKGNNSYSGATLVQGGTFSVSSAAALAGTTKVIVGNGGVISFNSVNSGQTFSTPLELIGAGTGNGAFYTYVEGSSLTWNGPINLLGTTLLQAYAGSSTVNLNGAIGDLAGGSDVTFFASGAAISHKDYFVLGGASTYGGDTILDNFAASCEVKLAGGANRLPVTTVLYLSSGHWNAAMISALDLNGNNQTLAGVADGAYASGARRIVNTSGTAATLTVNNFADFTFGGTLGGNDLAGVVGNNFAFIKNGAGQLALNGAAQHTGTTTLNAGTLLVNGTLNPSALTATSATLGGTGYVRSATLNVGALLKPGFAAGAGTLTFSNLVGAAGGTLVFDLTNALTVGGGVNDLLLATNVSFTGATTMAVTPLAPLAAGRYVLVRCRGALSGTGNLSLLPPLAGSRYQPALDFSVPNEVGLQITNGAAALSLTWKGSSANNTWDSALTTNWLSSGVSPEVFCNADSVLFDNSGISSNSINLAGSLAPAALVMNSASNYTFSGSGSLTGPVSPAVTGSGTWTLANSNNFSGGTLTVASGMVSLNYNSSSAGPELTGLGGVVVAGGATLRAAHPSSLSSVTFASVPLTLAGSGSGSYNGALKFDNGNNLSSVWPGAITLAGGATIHSYGVNLTTRLNGVISGGGPLTLAGRGGSSASHLSTYYLGAQNTYSGDTQLQNNDGLIEIMVRAATNNAVPAVSALAFGSLGGGRNVTFDLNGFNQQVAGLYTTGGTAVKRVINSNSAPATLAVNCRSNYFYDGVLGGLNATNFSLEKLGVGALVLAGTNTLSGAVTVAQGTLQLTNGLALPDTCAVTISNEPTATLELAGSETLGSLAGGGAVNLGSSTLATGGSGPSAVFSGIISGSGGFVKNGTNTSWTLSGSNTFSGGVNISEGSLIVKNSSSLGIGSKTVALNNGTAGQCALHLDGSGGGLVLGTNLAYSTSWASGSIVNDAGTNSVLGAIYLNSGGGDTAMVVNSGLMTLGGTISPIATGRNLRLGGAGNGLVSGVITNGPTYPLAGLRKLDGGMWTLSGLNLFSGPTTVEGGQLVVNGLLGTNSVTVFANATLGGSGVIFGPVTVNNGGTFSPGTGLGALTISNALTLNAGATNFFALNQAANTNDSVCGLTTVTYGGTLALTNLSGALTKSSAFKLFYADSYGGGFAALAPAWPAAGLRWNTNTLAVDGILRIADAPVPGIATSRMIGTNFVINVTNGTVGFAVYLQASTNLALPAAWTRVATNNFNAAGGILWTNRISPLTRTSFYRIEAP